MISTTGNAFDDLKAILTKIFTSDSEDIDIILSKFKYLDVCYYVIGYLTKELSSPKSQTPEFYQKVFNILSNLLIDDSHIKYSNKEAKKNKKINIKNVSQLYRKLWLKFLKSPMPEHIRLDAILTFSDEILDQIDDPSSFCDVMITSFEKNRESGIISFRGIFKLMLLNQMHYEEVYDVLFEYITEDIFKSPYCARVFDDLDSILSSRTMVHSIASKFIRRLAELTQFGARTHHIPMLVRLIINLLKKHTGTQTLIHDTNSHGDEHHKSLLEIKDLQNHFDGEIRTLAQEINSKLNDKIDNTRPSKSIESKEKKIDSSRERIKKAVESLMGNNCSLPELDPIEHFGTCSMGLF